MDTTVAADRLLEGLVPSSAPTPGRPAMHRVPKNLPISRAEFEAALADWAKWAQPDDTIGDVGDRGQKPWVFVRVDGELYYLNADSTKAGVARYLSMLAIAPKLNWTIVLNNRGRRNKVAFGSNETRIPGFFFYITD